MAIQSVNDLIVSAKNLQSHTAFASASFFRQSTHRPGSAHELYGAEFGYPSYPGSSTACVNVTQDNSCLLRYHGGNVSPLKKHLINIVSTSEAFTPGGAQYTYMLLLQDIQCYWKVNIGTSVDGVAQTLTGTPSLRYANGEGCFLYLANWSPSSYTPRCLAEVTYTNQSGASRTSPTMNIANNASVIGQFLTAGRHAGGGRIYLPLQGSDYGVQNVSSIKFSSIDYSGQTSQTNLYIVLGLARPLFCIPVTWQNRATSMIDFTKHVPSLPEIKDGACLSAVGINLDYNPSGTPNNTMAFQFVWG